MFNYQTFECIYIYIYITTTSIFGQIERHQENLKYYIYLQTYNNIYHQVFISVLNHKHIMDRARISAHWVSCFSLGDEEGSLKGKNGVLFIRNGNHEFSHTHTRPANIRKSLYTYYTHTTTIRYQ